MRRVITKERITPKIAKEIFMSGFNGTILGKKSKAMTVEFVLFHKIYELGLLSRFGLGEIISKRK